MASVITSFSRITIIAFVSMFFLTDVLLLIPKLNKIIKTILTVLQALMMVCFLGNATFVLYVNTQNDKLLFLFIGQLLFFSVGSYLLQTIINPVSPQLLCNVFMLLSFGFVTLERLDFDKAVRHFVFSIIALVLATILLIVIQKIKHVKDVYWLYGVIGVIGLLIVLVAGSVEYGAKLSIAFFDGKVSLQPSEFVKVLFIFFIASVCVKFKGIWGFFIASGGALLHVLILALSKDFGTAFIFLVTYVFMIFIAYGNYILLAVEGGVGIAVAYYVLNNYAHVQTRFIAWTDPLSVVDDQGYQICQSLFAIGTGGWLGSGLCQGMPYKIPVVAKDFIFAAISEEMGGIVGFELIGIYACVIIYIFVAAFKARERFYVLIASGFGVSFSTQAFLNIGGVTKFIPSTGVTLPFVSYGGSSLLALFIGFTLIEAVDDLSKLDGIKRKKAFARGVREAAIISAVFCLAFCALMYNLREFLNVESENFIYNSYNSRFGTYSDKIVRGDIKTSDGVVIATTVTQNGQEIRNYPYAELFCHEVGYVTKGMTGLESQYSFDLLKTHIALSDIYNNDLNGIKTQGDSLITTLDFDTQKAASDGMGSFKGAVVAIDPDTGKIVAMVSKPDYDTNLLDNYWELINNNGSGSSILLNRAVQGLYPPGSTFKIVTSLAYLRENNNDIDSFHYNCKGSLPIDDYTIHCSSNEVHGNLSMENAFADSCNSAFASMGLSLDRAGFVETADSLLFNSDIPAAIENVKKSSFKIDETTEDKIVGQSSIGQGEITVTPLHMAMLVSAIANNGLLMEPYIADHFEDADGDIVSTVEPVEYGQLLSADEAKIMQNFMLAVNEYGTGKKVEFNENLTVYGKTGTAEFSKDKSQTHSWYVGYAQDGSGKKLAVAVIMEGAGYGSKFAAPLASAVFNAYFE